MGFAMYYILNNTSVNNWSKTYNSIGQFFYIFFAIVLVLALSYFSTRFIASAKKSAQNGANIRVIETISMGVNMSIMLVKAGEKCMLLGVTKERITFLAEVSPEDITAPQSEGSFKHPFEKYLEAFKSKTR